MFHCASAGRGRLVQLVRVSVAASALLCLTASPSAFPQSTVAGSQDSAATGLLEVALSQLGGKATIAGLQDVQVTGICALSGSSPDQTTNFSWTASGQEFRYEANGDSILVSGHGRPTHSEAGASQSVPASFAEAQKAFFAPAFLLYRERNNPQSSILSPGQTIDGQNVVDIARSAGQTVLRQTWQRWYFDPSSSLPVRVEYWSPSVTTPQIGTQIALVLSSYKSFEGILFPTEITMLRGTSVLRKCSVSAVRINTNPADGLFDLSTDGGNN